jgi:hypothetical protein
VPKNGKSSYLRKLVSAKVKSKEFALNVWLEQFRKELEARFGANYLTQMSF